MGYSPTNLGIRLLEWTFQVGPSAGVLPWRIVCVDATVTVGYGVGGQAKIKHPATTHADGEKAIGVVVTPNALITTTPANAWEAFRAIAQNEFATVRLEGVVPILADDSTDGTNINAGDYVKASNSTNSLGTSGILLAGCAAKAALASGANNPDADQHIIGIAFNQVAPSSDSGRFVMTKISPVEA